MKSVALPVPEIEGVAKLQTPNVEKGALYMYPPNLKSVALLVPEIIGGTPKKLGTPWIRQCFIFSKMFNGLLFRLAL